MQEPTLLVPAPALLNFDLLLLGCSHNLLESLMSEDPEVTVGMTPSAEGSWDHLCLHTGQDHAENAS